MASEIIKYHQYNNSGIITTEQKTSKHKMSGGVNSGYKEERKTEEEPRASFLQKIKLREGTFYFCGKPGNIFPFYPKSVSTPKDKGNSKQQHKINVLSHRSLNRNLETKNHNQLKMKNTICQWSSHGQQEHKILFHHKVYSCMFLVI